MIKRLIKIEFRKVISYTTFWVLIGIHVFLLTSVILVAKSFRIDMPGLELPNLYAFPAAWNTISWLSSFFNLFLTIILIALVGNELNFRTFRQHVIDGLTRPQLVSGKLIVITGIAIFAFILTFLLALIFGLINTDGLSIGSMFGQFYYMFVYFIQTMAYMIMGLFIVLLIKNIALSIVTFILYFFPVEPILRAFLPDEITAFFPMKVISDLTPAPEIFNFSSQVQYYTTVNGQVVSQPDAALPFELPLHSNILVVLAYITLFGILSYIIMNKRNL
ncbi:MAG: ABC transporter permease [Bacteroidota bacterium]